MTIKMFNKPAKVSVVITAYNQSKFIGAAVDSVLRQSNPDVECIISDDGSVDETLELCRTRYRGNPRVSVVTQPNAGPGAARNHGFRHCATSSAYLVFLDGDDLLDEEFVATTVAYLDQNREVGLVTTGYRQISLQGELIGLGQRSRYAPGFLGLPKKLSENDYQTPFAAFYSATGQGPFALYRRTVFEQTAGWETGFWPHEDTDMFCQIALKAEVHHLPAALYLKREHPASVMAMPTRVASKSLAHFKPNSYELFRLKWLAVVGATKRERGILRAAEKYYYGRHMPLRNSEKAFRSMLHYFPRYSGDQKWWIKSLLKVSISAFISVQLLNRRPTAETGKVL